MADARTPQGEVQAVILAGGKGTRLRPVTAGLPKPLIPVANKPLILHQLSHLAASGVRDVTLALGYAADQFSDVAEQAEAMGVSVRIIVEPAPLGTGGALRWCADAGAFDDRPLLWMNGDVVASPSVDGLRAMHEGNDALVTFWLTQARDVSEFGVLETAADGRVQRFLEKPAPEETNSHLVNAGILMLDPQVLFRIPPDTFFSFEKNLLPMMVREQEPLYGLFDGGYWLDTGRPRFYLAANRHVLEGRIDWTPAGVEVEPGMWEGEGVKREGVSIIQPAVLGHEVTVEPGARLFGRTVVGDRSRVSDGAQLENCVLFDDVDIGRDVEVVNSIVCSGARVAEGAVLHDSIIGARAEIGGGNELRGARLWNDVALSPRALVIDV